MVNKCPPGEVYNIGGNRTMTIGEALDILLTFSKVRCEVQVDPQLLRPSDVTLQIPCFDKFRGCDRLGTGDPAGKTFLDLLDYWREELARSPWKALTVVR